MLVPFASVLIAAACPDASWTAANGRCYRATREWVPQWECASLCGPNASLACITSAAENAVAARLAARTGWAWFGLYQRPGSAEPSGGWDTCSTGEVTSFSNWAPEQPNDLRLLNQACVAFFNDASIHVDGRWDDVHCSVARPCICEHGASSSPDYDAFAAEQQNELIVWTLITFVGLIPSLMLLPILVFVCRARLGRLCSSAPATTDERASRISWSSASTCVNEDLVSSRACEISHACADELVSQRSACSSTAPTCIDEPSSSRNSSSTPAGIFSSLRNSSTAPAGIDEPSSRRNSSTALAGIDELSSHRNTSPARMASRAASRRIADSTLRHLVAAQRKAVSLRNRVSGTIAAVGWALLVVGFTPLILHMLLALEFTATAGHAHAYICAGFWACGVLPLALRPIDATRIAILCHLLLGVCLTLVLLMAVTGIDNATQPSQAAIYFALSALAFGAAAMATPTVLSIRGWRCVRSTMPPRRQLRRLLLSIRFLVVGVVCACTAFLVGYCVHYGVFMTVDAPLLNSLLISVVLTLPAPFLFTPNFRGSLHRRLGALGKSDSHVQEAAAIASLIGGRDIARALHTAREKFRVLPLASLTTADLKSSADTGLNARVRPAYLGECDAFVSHSWRDDGDQKYMRLHEHEWGTTDPSIWLDKVCASPTAARLLISLTPLTRCGAGLHRPSQHRQVARRVTPLPLGLQDAPHSARSNVRHPAMVYACMHGSTRPQPECSIVKATI
jgi:hypothetical protein